MQVIKIETRLQWMVTETANGRYVAFCDPIGLTTEGNDQVDLWMNIQESIQLLLNDLLKNGELEGFLRDRGWRSTLSDREQHDGRFPVPFEVPFELIAAQQNHRDKAPAPH